MVYPDYTVKANWFTAQVKVKQLSFSLSSVMKMEENSFNATAFKSLKKLVFPSMDLKPINKGLFNGLESLEILNLEGASSLGVIDKGVLDVLNQTLKEFTLVQLFKYVSEISIDGFTGSEQLEKLEYVKYNYKLESSITRKSFVGLQNVKILDLSDCQIVTIGPSAFDPISSSIEILKLENNLIQTLPEGLFDLMLPSQVTYIYLEGNKWVCDCNLSYFKWSLEEHENFLGTIQCNAPMRHKVCMVLYS